MNGPVAPGRLLLGILLAVLAGQASAADLGRLFLAPAERAALDRARYAAPRPAPEPDAGEAEPTLEELAAEAQTDLVPEPPIAVDGFVRRSGGPATIWINGIESNEGNLAEQGIDARAVHLAEDRVEVPQGRARARVSLKPGQRYDPDTSRITDAYETPMTAPGESSEAP